MNFSGFLDNRNIVTDRCSVPIIGVFVLFHLVLYVVQVSNEEKIKSKLNLGFRHNSICVYVINRFFSLDISGCGFSAIRHLVDSRKLSFPFLPFTFVPKTIHLDSMK